MRPITTRSNHPPLQEYQATAVNAFMQPVLPSMTSGLQLDRVLSSAAVYCRLMYLVLWAYCMLVNLWVAQ